MTNSNKQAEFVRVQVQVNRPRRFKAGSEKDSSAVNLAIHVEQGEEFDDFKLQLNIENNSCKAE